MSNEQLINTPGTFGDNDNFLLERELGIGGMGGVYMGRDKMLDRPVAVKVMQREYGSDAEFVEKFKREAQSAAKLIHPNIAQIYSYGISDGMPYIAMELVAGGSLYSIIQNSKGNTDIQRVLKICQQVALALQCANDQGYVHGDVKPENILLDANGNAKLVDFGLAGMQKNTDEIWGTPYYISPEKVKKEAVDFRADMYSLGGTLYHALTGIAPFEGDDAIAVVKKRFDGMPKKPSELRPEITPAVDALVMKMLAFNKEDRYPSFEALLDAFKNVLTVGLTQSLSTSATQSIPATGKRPVSGRRTVMRTRRMVKAGGTTTVSVGKVSEATAAEEGEKNDSDDSDEEEGGGNLAVKVILCIVGGILAIGAIIGGLFWFKASSEAAEKEAVRQQIQGEYAKAVDAVIDTKKKAVQFADEFDAFAQKAIVEVEKTTDELRGILPAEHAKLLKPEPSKELLDAIASTNNAPKAAVKEPATPPASTNAAPAATNATKTASKPADGTPDAKKGEKKSDTSKAESAKPEEKKTEEQPAEVPPIVGTMNELWNRAYGCQACAIRVRQMSMNIVSRANELDQYKEVTRENMSKVAELSRTLVDMLGQMKTSKSVEDVRTGISYVKDRGKTALEQTVKRLRIEKIEAERKAKKESAEAAERVRQERLAKERQALIKKEIDEVTAKFATISEMGCFRQLDWKSALRQLDQCRAEFKSAEGQSAADQQIRKVNNMKKAHDVFVKSMAGYVFKAGSKVKSDSLRGAKVSSLNESEIKYVSKDGKSHKILWQKFIKEYPGNFNEIINQFIIKGRDNAKPRLNLMDWADAMTGSALVMQLVCSEVNGAIEKASQLAQEAVKQFPDYAKTAKELFPDMEFTGAEE